MFLRIDVYPGGLQPAADAKDAEEEGGGPGGSPSETLFAYPALVKDDKRTLVEVGRKEPNDILLAQDKSVSRVHCKFILTSPSGSEAGEESTTRILTLENFGKTGSFVVAERPRGEKDDDKDDETGKDDGNDSDATDAGEDVGRGASTQLVAGASQTQRPAGDSLAYVPLMSEAAERALRGRGLDPKMYRLEPVGLDQSRHLTELDKDNSFVIVQCGKFDSTLVLTRKDMVVPSKAKSLLDPKLCESVGARMESHRFGPFTHFVTNKYSATVPMLTAWCLGVEFVTPDYLQTLAERVGPGDTMPVPEDYRPSPSSSSVKEGYWFKAPPSWAEWTFVAPSKASAEETVEWMRSTGAHVRIVDKESDLEEVVKAIAKGQGSEESRPKVFAVTQKQWLTKAQLEKAGVAVFDSRTLAARLTKFLSPDGTESVVASRPSIPSAATASAADAVVPVPHEPEHRSPKLPETYDEQPKSDELKPAGDRPKQATEAPEERITEESASPSTRTSKRTSRRTKESPQEPPEAAVERSSRRTRTAATPNKDVSPAQDVKEIDDSPRRDMDEEEKYNELVSRPRKLAKPSSDGWLNSAGPKRREGDEGNDYVRIKSTAVTEVVKGFVLKNPLGQSKSNATSRGRGVVDFRGFRKNQVAQTRNVAAISFVSVQPKEAQAALHMEEQRQQLEERQRMADDLFRDPEFPGGRARNRR